MRRNTWDIASAEPVLDDLFDLVREYREGSIKSVSKALVKNAKPQGIRIEENDTSSDGWVDPIKGDQRVRISTNKHGRPVYRYIPARYEITINHPLDSEEGLLTILHELAHLYCGHVRKIGTEKGDWWPSRWNKISKNKKEVEAECVAYLVRKTLKMDGYSREYLSEYARKNHKKIPEDSLNYIVAAANHIIGMC